MLAVTVVAALGSRSNVDADHRDRARLHADRRAHRARRRARRARSRLRPGGPAARGARAVHHVRRDPPERHAADHRRGDGAARLRDLRGRDASRSSASALQPPSPDWAVQIADNYHDPRGIDWWTVLFPALAIASLVVARQPGRGLGSSRCSSDERDATAGARRSRSSSRPRRRLPRARQRPPGAPRRLARGRARRGVRARRRVGLRQVDRRARDRPLPAAQRPRALGGSIRVAGRDVLALRGGELRRSARESVSMVYQNPGAALNPSIRVGKQVAEVVHGARRREAARRPTGPAMRSRACRSPTPAR